MPLGQSRPAVALGMAEQKPNFRASWLAAHTTPRCVGGALSRHGEPPRCPTPTTNNRPTPLPGSRKRSARRERMVQNECLCYGFGDHRKRVGEKPLPTGQSDHETNTRHRIAVLVDKLPGLAVCRNQAAQTQQAFVTFLVFYSQSHHCGHRTARTSREVAGFYRSRSWAVTPPNPGSTKPSRPQCPTLRRGSPAAVAAETGPRQSPTRAR